MHTTSISDQGGIEIPEALRKKWGLKRGTRVVFVETESGVEIRPASPGPADRFAGILSGEGRATQTLLDERHAESRRENDRTG